MQASTKARYALRILVDMTAYQGHGNVKIKDISARQNISVKYIEQIVVTLNKLGIVKGERGPNGGYTVNGDPSKITAGDVLRLIDGPSCPAPCNPANGPICPMINTCPTEEIWRRIGEAADAILDEYTLSDLAKKQASVITIDDGYYI